ncbi:MAG: hypothetical protein AAFU73_17755 [Planctomycetota bacterium]
MRLPVLTVVLLSLAACAESEGPRVEAERRERAVQAAPVGRTVLDDVSHPSADGGSTPARLPGGAVATVVDAQGLPVQGLEVAACVLDPDGALLGSIAWDGAARTAVDGTVPLPDGADHVATRLFSGVVVTSDHIDPHRIQLPPTGAIHLDLVAWPAGLRVLLTREAPDKAIEMLDVDDGHQVHVDRVPLGEEFVVTLQALSANGFERFRGPAQEGETVHLEPRPNYRFNVRIKAVDEGGAPVDGYSVDLTCENAGPSLVLKAERNAPGIFRRSTRRSAWDPPTGASIDVVVSGRWDEDTPTLYGSVVAPEGAPNEAVDLGTVVVKQSDLLVAGVVLDAERFPVPNASLWVNDEAGPKSQRPLARGQSAADGTFELRVPGPPGHALPAALVLGVLPVGAPAEMTRSITLGQRGVEIVLPGDGTIAVDPSAVEDRLAERVRVAVVRADLPGRRIDAGRLKEVSEIEVPPCEYYLSIHSGNQELARSPDFVVRSGQVTRLSADLFRELNRRFEVVDLRVVDSAADPVAGAAAHHRPVGGRGWSADGTARSDGNGMLNCILARDGTSESMVTAPEHGITLLSGVTSGDTVTLPSMVEIELVFDGPQPPGAPAKLIVNCNLAGKSKGTGWRRAVSRTVDGRYVVQIPGAGTFGVGIEYGAEDDWPWRFFEVPAGASRVVVPVPRQ